MVTFSLTPEAIAGAAVTLVSNDAGGAELVSRLARASQWQVTAVIDGPARRIFDEVLGNYPAAELSAALAVADVLVSGSGWSTTLEYDALIQARLLGIPSIAVLDHWVNYTERFSRNGRLVLPDVFWVGDRDALRVARRAFPDTPIVLVPNLLFEEALTEFGRCPARLSSGHGDRILVVCESISEHYAAGSPEATQLGYDENDALRFFLSNIEALSHNLQSITVRPHPHEADAKYNWAAREFPLLPLQINKNDTIIAAIADADIVVGCESTAMVLGLLAGRRVVSMIPPTGLACRLPQHSIEPLSTLVHAR